MNAIVSGRSGRALIIEGEELKSVDIDEPFTFVSRKRSDLPYLFGDAADLRLLENTTTESVISLLTDDSNFTLALDLTLISLDGEVENDIRREALEGIEELFADSSIMERVEHVMYSHLIPDDGNLDGALDICPSELKVVSEFLLRLNERQPSIARVDEAWAAIPTKTFEGSENRNLFRRTAVKEGLFHALATLDSPASLSTFLLKAGLNDSIRQLPNHRQVIGAWVTPFRQSREIPRIVEEDDDALLAPDRFDRRRIDVRVVLQETNWRKSQVIGAMHRRDLVRVRGLVNELISYQQSYSQSQHAAMSLCDLAMEAKVMGMSSLQLELTERSINIAPGDGWSWTQHADALLQMRRLDEALKASDQAIAFGGGVVAKAGRAEILKAKGHLDDALIVFEQAIKEAPENSVIKNGRAEVLKAQGHYDDALAAFGEVISRDFENVIAKTGRAEVLKAQGRFEAALTAYEDVAIQHPENIFGKAGRAEVLKTMGHFQAALTAYERVIIEHPESIVAKNGRADVLKAQGRFAAALSAYEEVISESPENSFARNGRSCALLGLRRYREALESVAVDRPIIVDDWIAYHIRGMILLRMGETSDAIRIFSEGVTSSPFPSTKEYFRGALGLSWLRGREFRKAAEALEEVTSPILQPSANVIRIHAFGAQGERGRARAVEAYENLANTPYLLNDELTQELHHQYVLGQKARRDDEWIFDREVRIFLRVA
jgi:tetratricopeptide (TPR) repeat protein